MMDSGEIVRLVGFYFKNMYIRIVWGYRNSESICNIYKTEPPSGFACETDVSRVVPLYKIWSMSCYS